MSATDVVVQSDETKSFKRKREDELTELEVDINAAEPPSKKALRKAKKGKGLTQGDATVETSAKSTQKSEARSGIDAQLNQGRSQWGIWIGNLLFTTTKEDLQDFVTSDQDHPIAEDEVTRIHLPQGQPKAGKPQNKGFAYVDFASETALSHALELSEKLLAGRRVLIKNAKSFEGRPASKEQVASGKPPSRRIFVGNLAFDTTSEMLEEHFGVCGTISKTQIATFEDSGKCKGYAWVEFEQLSAAEAAMRGWVEEGSGGGAKMSKRRIWLKQMNGRQLRMEFAEDATTRYNKRYGKDAKKTPGNGDEDKEDGGAPIAEVEPGPRPDRQRSKPHSEKSKYRMNGYEESTVKKLTGAITEGQGKKVVFD